MNRLLEEYFTPGSREWYEAQTYGIGTPAQSGQPLRNALLEEAAYIAPGTGEALSARDAWDASGRAGNALMSGNYGQAAGEYGNALLGILGALPGAGIIARGTKRGAEWMNRNLPSGVNRLLDAAMPADPQNTTFSTPTPWVGWRHDDIADDVAKEAAGRRAANPFDQSPYWREMQGAESAARADTAATAERAAERQTHRAAIKRELDDLSSLEASINAKADLPMDEASRMARAKEMGMRTNMPVYHGTNADINAFDLSRGGHTSGSRAGSLGVSVALDPETAAEFADLAAGKQGSGQNIVRLLHRAERPAVVHLTGDEKNLEIAATLQEAWDNGYDAVMMRNYTTPGGKGGRTILVVKDPAQLRSPNAKFDPAKRGSSDLLAGLAGASLMAPALAMGNSEQQ